MPGLMNSKSALTRLVLGILLVNLFVFALTGFLIYQGYQHCRQLQELAAWQPAANELNALMVLMVLIVLLTLVSTVMIYRSWQRQRGAIEALSKQEAIFRTVADYTFDWEYWQGLNQDIIYMTPSCERVTGYTQAEFIADPDLLIRIIYAEDRPIVERHFHDITRGIRTPADFRIVRRDGDIRWISHYCRVVTGDDGQALGHRASNRDITAAYQAQASLRASEEKLRGLYELSPLGICLTDMQGRFVDFNHAFLMICGYSEQELKALDYWTLTPNKYAADERRQQEALERTGRYGPYEKEYRRKNGSLVPLRLNGVLITGADGKDYIWSIVEDITERKQSEQALRESESRLNELFENMSSGAIVYRASEDGQRFIVASVNRAVERIEHVRRADLIGKNLEQAFPCAVKSGLPNILRRVWQSGVGEHFSLSFHCEGRMAGWRENYVYKLPGGEIVAIYDDVTQRKQAEEALRQQEALLRTVLNTLPVGVWVADAQGAIRTGNEAGRRIWGGARTIEPEQYGECKGWWHDTGKPIAAHEWALVRAIGKGDTALEEVIDIECFDGTRKTILNSAIPLRDDDDRITGAIIVNQDITERIAAEVALLQSNADLEQFAYSVSHDMRQPLRIVVGHLQLLARGLNARLDDEDRDNLNFALDGARRMDAMIVSLLEYSRVGRKTETKRWMLSRESLDEALSFLAPAIEEAGAEIEISGQWPRIFASHDELTRLFQNLLGNAVKYHEAGQPPRIEVASAVTAGRWRVSVRDYGIGIDPRQIDRLFQFFSRLQSRARFEGTGMGLALCRRIVEHHDGRIWVESEGEGQGSTFIFELPVKPPGHETGP
jgi:PAS domain S-box-containing protein